MWFRDVVESKGGNSYFSEDIETILWKKERKKAVVHIKNDCCCRAAVTFVIWKWVASSS